VIVTLWLLRALLLVHAVMVVAQPVTAGSYLSGNFDALDRHGTNGSLLLLATAGWGLATIAHAVGGRGAGWPLLLAVPVMFMAEGIQIGMGHQRNLAVHIPLGVFIVVAALLLVALSFTRAVKPRRRVVPTGEEARR
jgi:hypothetical protein